MRRAIGLCLVGAGIFLHSAIALAQERIEPALESQPVAEPRQNAGAEQSEAEPADQAEEPERLLPAMNAIESAIRELIPTDDTAERERQEKREVADLKSQQRMAFWAIWMFWATLAAVLLTGAGVYLIWQTLGHTRRAADAASEIITVTRDLGIQQMRAYVNAIDIKAQNFAPGMLAVFRCAIKNAGITPAYNLKILVVACDSADPDGEIRFRGQKPTSTAIIAGNDSAPSSIELPIPHDFYASVKAGKATVLVAGYIRYRDIFKVRRGVTFKTYLRFTDIKNGAGAMTAAGRNNYAN